MDLCKGIVKFATADLIKQTSLNTAGGKTDKALLDRLANSDQAAFKALYKRYWQRCYLQALRRSGDASLAEDITQNVFVTLWEKRKSAEIRNVAAYLFNAVRFRFIAYLKTQMHADTYLTQALQRRPDLNNSVETALGVKELQEAIDQGVAMMSPKTKAVYTLSRNEHYSVKEIATKLNLSEKAVEYHITQSLKTLRFALKDFLPFALIILEIF